MLELVIPEGEGFDSSTSEFVYVKETHLKLEHSLVSISKWEAKWKRPFLEQGPKTSEETIDYVRCMTITQNVNPIAYTFINGDHMKLVNDYINDPMTATKIRQDKNAPRGRREIYTSEVLYAYMVTMNIPFECQ